MKIYIFILGICSEVELIGVFSSREKAEYVMESYVEAEIRIWKSEQYAYKTKHWWDIVEMEVVE